MALWSVLWIRLMLASQVCPSCMRKRVRSALFQICSIACINPCAMRRTEIASDQTGRKWGKKFGKKQTVLFWKKNTQLSFTLTDDCHISLFIHIEPQSLKEQCQSQHSEHVLWSVTWPCLHTQSPDYLSCTPTHNGGAFWTLFHNCWSYCWTITPPSWISLSPVLLQFWIYLHLLDYLVIFNSLHLHLLCRWVIYWEYWEIALNWKYK